MPTKALSKWGVVLGGYAVALLVSSAAAYIWMRLQMLRGDPSGGMQAFGNLILFVGLFGLMALIPTGLAFYFLRPFAKFWTVFSIVALLFAASAPFAAITRWPSSLHLSFVAAVGFVSVWVAPLSFVGFLVCAVIAPTPRSRWVLLAASGVEFAVCAYVFVSLFVFGHWLL